MLNGDRRCRHGFFTRQTDGKARPDASAEGDALREAQRLLAELRYVRRFAEEIAAFEDES